MQVGRFCVKSLLTAFSFQNKVSVVPQPSIPAWPGPLGLAFGRGGKPLNLQAGSGQSRGLKNEKPKLGQSQLRVLHFGISFQAFGWSSSGLWDSSKVGRA